MARIHQINLGRFKCGTTTGLIVDGRGSILSDLEIITVNGIMQISHQIGI